MCTRIDAIALVGLLFLGAAGACKSKPSPAASADASAVAASANLTDLSNSLDAVRSAFNLHKKQARFLTLLSPA